MNREGEIIFSSINTGRVFLLFFLVFSFFFPPICSNFLYTAMCCCCRHHHHKFTHKKPRRFIIVLKVSQFVSFSVSTFLPGNTEPSPRFQVREKEHKSGGNCGSGTASINPFIIISANKMSKKIAS